MSLIKREIQDNTPEQALQYLEAALELVNTLEPADDLRALVFGKAVDLLSAKQIVMEQVAPTGMLLGQNGMRG